MFFQEDSCGLGLQIINILIYLNVPLNNLKKNYFYFHFFEMFEQSNFIELIFLKIIIIISKS